MSRRARVLLVASLLVCLPASALFARELTFDVRVRAQEAIERVYYSHQIGVTRSFEAAVPRELLERKVRAYLKEGAALKRFWDVRVTEFVLAGDARAAAASPDDDGGPPRLTLPPDQFTRWSALFTGARARSATWPRETRTSSFRSC